MDRRRPTSEAGLRMPGANKPAITPSRSIQSFTRDTPSYATPVNYVPRSTPATHNPPSRTPVYAQFTYNPTHSKLAQTTPILAPVVRATSANNTFLRDHEKPSSSSFSAPIRTPASLQGSLGSSTIRSRSSSKSSVMGSGGRGELAQLVTMVPHSALSTAQWAARSDSSSRGSGGLNSRSSFSTSTSTPSFLQNRGQRHPLSTNSSTPSKNTFRPGSVGSSASSHSTVLEYVSPTVIIRRAGETTVSSDNGTVRPDIGNANLNNLSRTPSVGISSRTSDCLSSGSSRHIPADTPINDVSLDGAGSHGQSMEDATPKVIMSISWSQGKLGAAFYDASSSQVYAVEDKVEAAPEFWILRTLFREQLPRVVVVGGRQDQRLFSVLRELCGVPSTPLCQTSPNTQEGADREGRGGREGASPSLSLSSANASTIRILPMADFKYELCVRRVLSLSLPGEPEGMTEGERELYMRSKVNTDLVSMTRALGALLRFLDKHGMEVVGPMDSISICGLQIYNMEEIAQIDEATVASLQVFSEDQHPAAFKKGKSSASKEGLSLYALLSRTACPMAAHTLRRVLLRPVMSPEVLEARYDAVSWGVDPANLDIVRQLQSSLRHITNVTHTVGRLQRGQLSVRDWKVLYKSMYNSILVGEICQAQDQNISIFKQTGEGVTEGLYRATFLIQRIMDMDQSQREARFVVKPGVDPELDDRKRRFSGLGEVMRRVAEVELTNMPEEVETCCIIYLPHVGYLLAFQPPHNRDLQQQHYELPGLEFMFETADMAFYKSPTCCELDTELGDIQVEIANHETRIMMRLIDVLLPETESFLALINHIVMLDCLLSFSVVSRECGWVRPELTEEAVLEVKDGRHPLYELCSATFVSNPINSGANHPSITLVTGPNASGKTVYLKQVGVLVLLAQVGCWVPASYARLRPVDAVIAVTQSTPPITSHLSTFMLDLTRMCTAVSRATKYSLVIIDEFGASTYENDGAALLTSCIDHWGAMAKGRQVLEVEEQGRGEERERESGREEHEKRRREGNLEGEEESYERRSRRSDESGDSENPTDEENTSSRQGDRRRKRMRRRQEEVERVRGRSHSPHVYVSTHLLQVYDHLLYPDTVRCLVLEGVVEGTEGRIVPLYQVAEGRATASFAASVAAIVGVPAPVVVRAKEVTECIRMGQRPQRWTLLEDEDDTRRCRAVVSLFLSHVSSKQPLQTLLPKVRQYAFPSTPSSPSKISSPESPGQMKDEEARVERILRELEGQSNDARILQYISQDILIRDIVQGMTEHSQPARPQHDPAQSPQRQVPQDGSSESQHAHTSQHTPEHIPTPGQTPQHTPGQTSQHTPGQTPQHTPGQTPQHTPGQTPQHTHITHHTQAPAHNPQHTPGQTPQHTPGQTPQHTPGRTLQHTPGQTPQHTPGQTPQHTPGQTPQHTPGQTSQHTPGQTSQNTPGQTPQHTPGQTPQHTPGQTSQHTPGQTPQHTPGQTSQNTPRQTLQHTRTPQIRPTPVRQHTNNPQHTPGQILQHTPGQTPQHTPSQTPQHTPGQTLQHTQTPQLRPIPVRQHTNKPQHIHTSQHIPANADAMPTEPSRHVVREQIKPQNTKDRTADQLQANVAKPNGERQQIHTHRESTRPLNYRVSRGIKRYQDPNDTIFPSNKKSNQNKASSLLRGIMSKSTDLSNSNLSWSSNTSSSTSDTELTHSKIPFANVSTSISEKSRVTITQPTETALTQVSATPPAVTSSMHTPSSISSTPVPSQSTSTKINLSQKDLILKAAAKMFRAFGDSQSEPMRKSAPLVYYSCSSSQSSTQSPSLLDRKAKTKTNEKMNDSTKEDTDESVKQEDSGIHHTKDEDPQDSTRHDSNDPKADDNKTDSPLQRTDSSKDEPIPPQQLNSNEIIVEQRQDSSSHNLKKTSPKKRKPRFLLPHDPQDIIASAKQLITKPRKRGLENSRNSIEQKRQLSKESSSDYPETNAIQKREPRHMKTKIQRKMESRKHDLDTTQQTPNEKPKAIHDSKKPDDPTHVLEKRHPQFLITRAPQKPKTKAPRRAETRKRVSIQDPNVNDSRADSDMNNSPPSGDSDEEQLVRKYPQRVLALHGTYGKLQCEARGESKKEGMKMKERAGKENKNS